MYLSVCRGPVIREKSRVNPFLRAFRPVSSRTDLFISTTELTTLILHLYVSYNTHHEYRVAQFPRGSDICSRFGRTITSSCASQGHQGLQSMSRAETCLSTGIHW